VRPIPRAAATLGFEVQFLRPVQPARIVGNGKVVRRVADVAYLEASLSDSRGATIATATAIARVIPLDQAKTAV
jgi:acyl-coenzyme A thioesterase PaaI-like protein